MRYWIYKCNRIEGGPAGYWGDWSSMVFHKSGVTEWGGSYASRSPEVWNYLDHDVSTGDVIVAYQTDEQAVLGFCTVARITGPLGDRFLRVRPIERLATPLKIHRRKHGTILAKSNAVNGPVMLRELQAQEMKVLLELSGSPSRILRGKPAASGYQPLNDSEL